MKELFFNTIQEFNDFIGVKTLHPLVSVVRVKNTSPIQEAQYFSFGTNDLTQMTFGYSRDDIASFLPAYMEKKILKVDPLRAGSL